MRRKEGDRPFGRGQIICMPGRWDPGSRNNRAEDGWDGWCFTNGRRILSGAPEQKVIYDGAGILQRYTFSTMPIQKLLFAHLTHSDAQGRVGGCHELNWCFHEFDPSLCAWKETGAHFLAADR